MIDVNVCNLVNTTDIRIADTRTAIKAGRLTIIKYQCYSSLTRVWTLVTTFVALSFLATSSTYKGRNVTLMIDGWIKQLWNEFMATHINFHLHTARNGPLCLLQ